MPGAFLVGFQYRHNMIPGVILDLWRAYKFSRETMGASVSIVSDILPEEAAAAALDESAYPGISEFLSGPMRNHTVVRARAPLRAALAAAHPPPDGRLFIYYTGHGVREALVLPSQERLAAEEVRDAAAAILSRGGRPGEVFCVLDCCNPDALRLPYRLEGKAFVGTGQETTSSPRFLLLAAAAPAEKAVATKGGSLFSRHLFSTLGALASPAHQSRSVWSRSDTVSKGDGDRPEFKRDLPSILHHIGKSVGREAAGYHQTPSAYSSRIEIPLVWGWIAPPANGTIVDIDYATGTVYIDKGGASGE